MKPVFVDTGAWFAWMDRADPDHDRIIPCFEENRSRLVTSNYVLDETITLMRFRLGVDAARRFGDLAFEHALSRVEQVRPKDEVAAWEIFKRFSDQEYSFTDCTSFAIMERLKAEYALTLDSDFRSYGIPCLPD